MILLLDHDGLSFISTCLHCLLVDGLVAATCQLLIIINSQVSDRSDSPPYIFHVNWKKISLIQLIRRMLVKKTIKEGKALILNYKIKTLISLRLFIESFDYRAYIIMAFKYLMRALDFHIFKKIKLSNFRDKLLIFVFFYSKDLTRLFYPEFVSSHCIIISIIERQKWKMK